MQNIPKNWVVSFSLAFYINYDVFLFQLSTSSVIFSYVHHTDTGVWEFVFSNTTFGASYDQKHADRPYYTKKMFSFSPIIEEHMKCVFALLLLEFNSKSVKSDGVSYVHNPNVGIVLNKYAKLVLCKQIFECSSLVYWEIRCSILY